MNKVLLLLALVGVAVTPSTALTQAPESRDIVVASKPFGESFILAETFSQLLESRGFKVVRRPGLGATEIAFTALKSGDIDLYPEYTGTGLLAILDEAPEGNPADVFARVATEFRNQWGIRWLPPLGFENSYAIAVRPETAEQYGLATLSDVAAISGELVAGFTPDFIGRPDGLPGIRDEYNIDFRDVRSLLPAVKYQALAAGSVDIIDGYSTDGLISRYGLFVLTDDRQFFPPYQAAALVGAGVVDSFPGVISALSELSGRIDVELMRRMNRLLEVDGVSIERVAATLLTELALVRDGDSAVVVTSTRSESLWSYLSEQRARLFALTLRHLLLVSVSLFLAILCAVPLGMFLERLSFASAEGTVRGIGLLQTVPSIALLAFMIPLLGIGMFPAMVALFLYSLYPIVRNTYSGIRDADPAAVAGATACGMTTGQVLRHVRLPMATPVIMSGIRTAAVINVGTATLAAFIGAGGLGDPIVAGLALSDTNMILSGAIPAALLALVVDGTLGAVERLVRPGGLK